MYRAMLVSVAVAGLIVGLATGDWDKARALFVVALLSIAFYGSAYLRTGGWGERR